MFSRFREPHCSDMDDPVEVQPPQTRDDRHPEQRRDDHARVERKPFRSDSDGDDRFSERDQEDLSESLDEVCGGDGPAAHVPEDWPDVVDRDGRSPAGELR